MSASLISSNANLPAYALLPRESKPSQLGETFKNEMHVILIII